MRDVNFNKTKSVAQPDIFWQDEILQVMYWMRGEGFARAISVSDLRRFLDADPELLSANIAVLCTNGLLEPDAADRYRLTQSGVREGGRRFADEFDGMLRQGHYECDDPDCDCHGPDATPCVAAGSSHKH